MTEQAQIVWPCALQ